MKKIIIVGLSVYSMASYGMGGGVVVPLLPLSNSSPVGSPGSSPRNTIQTCQEVALKKAVGQVEISLQGLFKDERITPDVQKALMTFLNAHRSSRRKGSHRLRTSSHGQSSPSTPRNLVDFSNIFPKEEASSPNPCSSAYTNLVTRNIYVALAAAAQKDPSLQLLSLALAAEIKKLDNPAQ